MAKRKHSYDITTGAGQKRLMYESHLGYDPGPERIIDISPGDYGADPIGGGKYRMVPSGDIVDFEERNRRLKARRNPPKPEYYKMYLIVPRGNLFYVYDVAGRLLAAVPTLKEAREYVEAVLEIKVRGIRAGREKMKGRKNPLTRAETRNLKLEALVHSRIPGKRKSYYKGMAAGMRDAAEQYGKNPKDFYVVLFDENGNYEKLISGASAIQLMHDSPEQFVGTGRIGKSFRTKAAAQRYVRRLISQRAGQYGKNPGASVMPGLSKWNYFAGGTSAAPGKHSYSINFEGRKYSISPFTTAYGRHAGYILSVFPGRNYGHEQLGKFMNPYRAVKIARDYAAKISGTQIQSNPKETEIYGRVKEIVAVKGPGHKCDAACKRAGHTYIHKFTGHSGVYGLPDGSLSIHDNN